jgi:DNA repair protein RecO (recombination protein O)
MITKTEAIVLRTVEFQESSLIATLFTRKHGKIAVIAKGARKPKSKLAAFLVPGQLLEVVYYMRQNRSVQTLSDVSYLQKLDKLRVDMEKMALAVTTLELAAQLVHDNEENDDLFLFLLKMLPWLNDRDQVSRTIFPYIQIRLAQLSGIGLQFEEEYGTEDQIGYINIETGTLSTEAEGGKSVRLTPLQFAFVRESLHSMKSAIFEMNLKKNELTELIEYLDSYFRYHIDGIRPRKSDAIFDQILKS